MLELIGWVVYDQNMKKKEGFSSSGGIEWIFSFIVSVIISVFCIYLSWNCNSSRGTDTGLKIFYAFFAFLFGFFYLIFYFFANYLGRGCSAV